MEINKNKKAICGIKITIPPSPGMIPSVIKFEKTPGGKLIFNHSLNNVNELSIKSIG